MKTCDDLGLDKLFLSSYKFHLRIWCNSEVIEVWENENGIYSGKLIYWVTKCDSSTNYSHEKIYSEYTPIPSSQSLAIIRLFKNEKIYSIPTDNKIKGWNKLNVIDGISYTIELYNNGQYSFKEYNNPLSRFKDLKIQEGLIINNFIDSAQSITQNPDFKNTFRHNIPFDCYKYNVGITVTKAKVLSKRKFRRSTKDLRKTRRKKRK